MGFCRVHATGLFHLCDTIGGRDLEVGVISRNRQVKPCLMKKSQTTAACCEVESPYTICSHGLRQDKMIYHGILQEHNLGEMLSSSLLFHIRRIYDARPVIGINCLVQTASGFEAHTRYETTVTIGADKIASLMPTRSLSSLCPSRGFRIPILLVRV